ncbi:MAG: TetR/AcrR family transcriptional regulator [Selenomonas ruminantium]|uniref:TetR/AcrR family transcriptional regulator n=1 Tax=Selenomonas ruminantium TaxID=971 RepID=A0A927WPJ9_SELRU|nr:TetR/AcrR family transcriptional regulator [Selenomonas ruminantium]
MSGKEDLRIIKTRRNIESTFISLLEKFSFEQITVKKILENALISKGTFYAHYLDKYDLAEKIVMSTLEDFRTGIKERLELLQAKEPTELWPSLQKTLQTVLPRLLLLKKIHTDKIDVDRSVKAIIREEYLAFQQKQGNASKHPALRAQIATNLVLGFIEWQSEQPQSVSLQDYVEEVHKLSTEYREWLK